MRKPDLSMLRQLVSNASDSSVAKPSLTRRSFLRAALGATALTATGLASTAHAGFLTPTEPNTEGPFYRAGAPFRNQLYPDDEPGPGLLVWGRILAPDATPLGGALLDVWQADWDGEYDNTTADYFGRGKQLANDEGVWHVWTVAPGYYPGRPRHLHIKASDKGYRALTSQLYFIGDPRTSGDPFFRPSLAMYWQPWEEGAFWAYYDIVLARA